LESLYSFSATWVMWHDRKFVQMLLPCIFRSSSSAYWFIQVDGETQLQERTHIMPTYLWVSGPGRGIRGPSKKSIAHYDLQKQQSGFPC